VQRSSLVASAAAMFAVGGAGLALAAAVSAAPSAAVVDFDGTPGSATPLTPVTATPEAGQGVLLTNSSGPGPVVVSRTLSPTFSFTVPPGSSAAFPLPAGPTTLSYEAQELIVDGVSGRGTDVTGVIIIRAPADTTATPTAASAASAATAAAAPAGPAAATSADAGVGTSAPTTRTSSPAARRSTRGASRSARAAPGATALAAPPILVQPADPAVLPAPAVGPLIDGPTIAEPNVAPVPVAPAPTSTEGDGAPVVGAETVVTAPVPTPAPTVRATVVTARRAGRGSGRQRGLPLAVAGVAVLGVGVALVRVARGTPLPLIVAGTRASYPL